MKWNGIVDCGGRVWSWNESNKWNVLMNGGVWLLFSSSIPLNLWLASLVGLGLISLKEELIIACRRPFNQANPTVHFFFLNKERLMSWLVRVEMSLPGLKTYNQLRESSKADCSGSKPFNSTPLNQLKQFNQKIDWLVFVNWFRGVSLL